MKRAMRGDKSAEFRWKKPVAMAIFASPALAINVTHGIEAGKPAALIFAAALCVIGAALCAERTIQQRFSATKLINGCTLAILLAFNYSNAIGLAAGHRSAASNEALTLQAGRENLGAIIGAMEGEINTISRRLNGTSASSLTAKIAALEHHKIYSRTAGCSDVTIDESRAHCAELATKRALLADAERLATLQIELKDARIQISAAPVVISSDPQGEALAAAFAFAGLVIAPRDVGYGLTLLLAAAVELLAAFGGTWLGTRTSDAVPAQKVKSEPVKAEKPAGEALEKFFNQLQASRDKTAFKQLYAEYERLCSTAGETPITRRALGLKLSQAFDKAKGGDSAYYCRSTHGLKVVSV